MRILLAHNSLYYPSHGGGDKSNRLLMESLAERGHEVRVVTRVESFSDADHDKLLRQLSDRNVPSDTAEQGIVRLRLNGVDVRTLTRDPRMRVYFSRQIEEFNPDIILTSTDDPGQILFDLAIRAPQARVVYLVRATIAVPFGPDSSSPSVSRTENLRYADGIVGVSHYVADYMKEWGRLNAIHVPISLLEPGSNYTDAGRFENPYVTIVNPCAVKGMDIFVPLAERMPDVAFAAVPTWGATEEDMRRLRALSNVTLLKPFDDIDGLLRLTKVMLVPSVWAEARSRVILESMSRGVPVVASDIGGIPEAKLGVPYLLPVNPIRRYAPAVDRNMVPVAEVPAQNIAPWMDAVNRLVKDRDHWNKIAAQSRRAALEYASQLNVLPFESYLQELLSRPKKTPPADLSDEKKKLLALRLKQRAATNKPEWFSGLADRQPGKPTLFCFPYAGGGTMPYRDWGAVAIRLPGRESRLSEPPFETMEALIAKLGPEIVPHLKEPFEFFGHSMGAIIAFELSRWLRANNHPLPKSLHVSAARAPQFRLNHQPPPEPDEAAFLEELHRLEGIPKEILDKPELMRIALPAIKADASLYRKYIYQPGEPLPIPIHAYGGLSDSNVTTEHLEPWREQTTSEFTLQQFEGGHFFLQNLKGSGLRR